MPRSKVESGLESMKLNFSRFDVGWLTGNWCVAKADDDAVVVVEEEEEDDDNVPVWEALSIRELQLWTRLQTDSSE